ncbi:sugar transferase [Erysipelothrix rhusiopathiae SY1027]|nr:sugar transferase [Erysipelothrix rhusiopathiae SY1027]
MINNNSDANENKELMEKYQEFKKNTHTFI